MAAGEKSRKPLAPVNTADARDFLRQAALHQVPDLGASPGSFGHTGPPVVRSQLAAPPGVGGEPALVREPGGQVLNNLLHPAMHVIEQMNRVLPDDSWYDLSVSPARPIQFEVLGYRVPNQMHLWIYDYEFLVYRLSGSDPADIVEAEPGRFTGAMGFDITVQGMRPANLLYQLDPQAVATTRASFNTQGTPAGAQPTAAQFNSAAAASFASTAGIGQSLLPVRRQVQGPEGQPWTMIAKEGEWVALSCVIFRRVRTPIGALEARFAGYLMQSNMSNALLDRMRPR